MLNHRLKVIVIWSILTVGSMFLEIDNESKACLIGIGLGVLGYNIYALLKLD